MPGLVCVELAFADDPARLAARPAHRARLQKSDEDGLLLGAGPWDDDSGALIVLRTDLDQAQAILAADPYLSTSGVTVVAVRGWDTVVGP